MKEDKLLDFSTGDAAFAPRYLAQHAFNAALDDINQYQITDQTWTVTNAIHAIIDPIREYFTSRGIYDKPNYTGLTRNGLLMTGGGTTEGYALALMMLAQDIEKENAQRAQYGRTPEAKAPLKPAILMPVPSYGFFFEQPKLWGFEIIKIERDLLNSGALSVNKINEAIKKAHKEGHRIVAWFDSNPNNPLGTVRTQRETEEIAQLLNYYSHQYAQQDQQDTDRRMRWEGPAARIRMIDDMVYDGTQYEGELPPYSFAQIEGNFRNTIVLAGLSKIGLASQRAGLVITDRSDIQRMAALQRGFSYSLPKSTMMMLSGWFNNGPAWAESRKEHLKKLSEAQCFGGKFMKVLFNGAAAFADVTTAERRAMENYLVAHAGMTLSQARQRLLRGIEGVRVITSPQAGFFHLLDFSALRGARYHRVGEEKPQTVKDEEALGYIFKKAGLRLATGSFMGLASEKLIARANFAKSPEDIIDFVARIEHRVLPQFETAPRRERGVPAAALA